MLTSRVSDIGNRALAPVAPEDRVVTLDILRGFTMFGVLWSNLNNWYGTLKPATAMDHALAWVQEWLVDSRFYTMLGFVFGIGFAIQLQRAEARGTDARNVFLRRMAVLLGFGLFHGLFIWSGDILTYYALLGFLLVLYQGLSQKRLAVAAALTYALLPYVIPRIFILLNLPIGAGGFFQGDKVAASILGHGTFAQVATYRIEDFLYRLRGLTLGSFAGFLTLFLLGMLAARAGVISRLSDNARQNTAWLRWVFIGSLVCIAAGTYWFQNFEAWWPVSPPRPPAFILGAWHDLRFWSLRGTFFYLGLTLLLWGTSAAYASALAMLSVRREWSARLAPLAAVGRMPLTTYLTQSVVCTTLFYGYGFGLWGRVGWTGMLGITLTIFSLQMVGSVYWLRYFRFGPAEWLWRSLAYMRPQPMRTRPAEPSSFAATRVTTS